MANRVVDVSTLTQFTAVNLLSDPGAIGGPKIAPNCAQIVIGGALEDGKVWHCVLGGRYSGAFSGTSAQANAILAALSTGANWTALAAFLATSTNLTSCTIRDINSANQPLISNTSGGAAGSSASPAMPNETSAVVTFRTALAGRANRGRMYVPGWATNALGAGNVIAAGAVTALQAWAQGIPTALAAQGYTHVIVQPARAAYTGSTGTQHPARAATSQQITTLLVRDNHWDTQRRRGLK